MYSQWHRISGQARLEAMYLYSSDEWSPGYTLMNTLEVAPQHPNTLLDALGVRIQGLQGNHHVVGSRH